MDGLEGQLSRRPMMVLKSNGLGTDQGRETHRKTYNFLGRRFEQVWARHRGGWADDVSSGPRLLGCCAGPPRGVR